MKPVSSQSSPAIPQAAVLSGGALRDTSLQRDVVRLLSAVAGLAAVLLILSHFIDAEAVQANAARLNAGVAFALLTLLPLLGFPVNVLHLAAGVRFGFAVGMALVSLSILLQLLASFALVSLKPDLFARHLAGLRKRIPPAAHGTLCMFTLLLPGLPYFLQNYTLALTGVPLRIYLSRGWPLHVLRSVVTVGLGGQSGHFTPAGLVALAVYWLLLVSGSWWFYRRLRRQIAGQPAAGGGPMPPA